jgi:hypothetical protein
MTKYIARDELIKVGASELYADANVFTGKLYDQAFQQRRNGGASSGGIAIGTFNGKEIRCLIVPRCMGGGRWSSTTRWTVNGKRVAQKLLISKICEES